MKKGFNFDEAILMAKFAKQVYEIFQYDDGNVDDSELKDIYNSINRNQGWKFVHSIRNDETNARGLIAKNKSAGHQYTIAMRGSIITDRGALELSDLFVSDANVELINYGSMTDQRIKVSKGFYEVYTSVSDQVRMFFKTLTGRLTEKDFSRIDLMSPEGKFACATALADAGSIRLEDAEFDRQVQRLISEAVEDGEIGNDGDVEKIIDFVKEKVLAIESLKNSVEVYVAGHSMGGAMASLCALDLRRCLGNADNQGLGIKVYTIGSPKIGNIHFANYYNQQIGEGMSYRVENFFDIVPQTPPEIPFPLSVLVPNGLRIGSFYLGNCVGVGESHGVMGLGSQGVSVDFGGALELLGGLPFPHSFDTYIQLLEEQQKQLKEWLRPIKNILGSLIQEQLQEQTQEIKQELEDLKSAMEGEKNGKGLIGDNGGGQGAKTVMETSVS